MTSKQPSPSSERCEHGIYKINCSAVHSDTPLPSPSSESWVEEFEKQFVVHGGVMPKHRDIGQTLYRDLIAFIKNTITAEVERGRIEAQEEYKQFVLNVLDGIDQADEQLGNKGGGTKAIRFALKNRQI